MERIRVIIGEDDPLLREVLSDLLNAEPSLELIAVGADAEEVVELTALHRPDVTILDVRMPCGGGPRAAREIRSRVARTRLVALSAHEDRASVLEMLGAGATGYLVKGASAEEIVTMIHRISRGESVLAPSVMTGVVQELSGQLGREHDDAERRRLSTERIRVALDTGSPAIVFQPIVALADRRVVALEALARFAGEPARPPDVWFAEAADVGLGLELELAAARNALAGFELMPAGMWLSINASPAFVTSDVLAELIESAPRREIGLEITEHARIEDYDALQAVLVRLRAAGVRLAVDDAGAGYASLRHIVRLAPDAIKLDRALTSHIESDATLRAVATAMISFGRETGAVVIAEGIETREELEALLTLGVEYGQGYYLGRPAPLAEALGT